MKKTPLITKLQPVSDEFDASLIATWVEGALVGAFEEDGKSYLMRWTAPGTPYEPLFLIGWRVAQLAGAPVRPRMLAVIAQPGQDRKPFGAFVLDFDRQERAELVDPETGLLVSADGATIVWSPDGRHVAIGNVSVADDTSPMTLLFDLDADEERRWLLSGIATRWDADGLVLLREHGCARWTPEEGDTFLGDAPPIRSPDGKFALILHEAAIEIRGADGIERRFERPGEELDIVGWIGPDKLLIGVANPVVLELSTLETQPLVDAPGGPFAFVEATPDGKRLALTNAQGVWWAEQGSSSI
jgi:hypothetical protein